MPEGAWRHIRDEDRFDKVIREIKNRQEMGQESTMTGSITEGVTQDVSEQIKPFHGAEVIQEPKLKVPDPTRPVGKVEELPSAPLISYEADTSTGFRKWVVVSVIVLVFVGLFVLKDYEVGQINQIPQTAEELKKEGVALKESGQFDEAKKSFELALQKDPSDSQVQYELAVLNVYFQDTITAQRQLESLLNSQNANVQSISHNMLGVIALNHYNYKNAQEHFDKAIQHNSQNTSAYFNKGMVLFLTNQVAESEQYFLKSIENGGSIPEVLLMLTEILFVQKASEGKLQRLNELEILISKYLSDKLYMAQEIKVAKGYVHYLKNNKAKSLESFQEALDMDPYLTDLHVPNITLYRDRFSWNYINQWIKNAKLDLDSTPRMEALLALGLFKGRDKIEGRTLIESALKRDPMDLLVQSVYSYIYYSVGREDEAMAALKIASKSKKFTLPHILKARFCEKSKKWNCVESSWRQLLLDNPNMKVAALGGLATALFNMNKAEDEVKDYISTGLEISPNYSPLLKVRYELGKNK